MRVSKEFIEFLASWEGESLKAYRVPGENFLTIGVGHARMINGRPITATTVISRAKSRELLAHDLRQFEDAVKKHVPWAWRRRRRRFETMVSLAFNMGEEILTPTPPLTSFGQAIRGRRITGVRIRNAATAIELFNKGGTPLRVMPGLVRRRTAEAHLFKTGEYQLND